MWKVTVISYSSTSDRVDIVFSHSHAIGDGNSVPRALNDWMVNYDKLSTLDESTLLSNIQSLPPLSSPLQLYFPDGIGYANKIKAWIGAKMLLRDFEGFHSRVPMSDDPQSSKLLRSRVLLQTGEPSTVDTLRDKARVMKTTIGSIVNAILAFETAAFAKQTHTSTKDIKISYAANLRPWIENKRFVHDYFHLIIGIGELKVDVTDGSKFWDVARMFNTQTKQDLASGMFALGMQVYASLISKERSKIGALSRSGKRTGDLTVSNVGPFPYAQEIGDLALDSLFTLNPTTDFGGPYTLFINTSNRLCYSLVYNEPLNAEEDAASLMNTLVEKIETAHSFPAELTFSQYSML